RSVGIAPDPVHHLLEPIGVRISVRVQSRDPGRIAPRNCEIVRCSETRVSAKANRLPSIWKRLERALRVILGPVVDNDDGEVTKTLLLKGLQAACQAIPCIVIDYDNGDEGSHGLKPSSSLAMAVART